MDLSCLTLEIDIIQFLDKWNLLSPEQKVNYTIFLKQEFYAIDDEYSTIFDHIFYCLERSNNLEKDLTNCNIPNSQLSMCIRACISYYNDAFGF